MKFLVALVAATAMCGCSVYPRPTRVGADGERDGPVVVVCIFACCHIHKPEGTKP